MRKHARRAVKAAFAVALAIPIVLGGTANAGTNGTTITVGTKNFTEAFVLGQLYKQALEAKGYKVAYKENIGSSELLDTALTSGKINFAPGVHGCRRAQPRESEEREDRGAELRAAKAYEEKRGYTLLKQTPFFDADSFAVLKKTAAKYGLQDDLRPEEGAEPVVRRLPGVRQADHVSPRAQADLRADEDQVRPARDDPGDETDRQRHRHRR